MDISGLGGGGGGGGMGLEKQIVAGGAHTCSLTTGEGLKCWGSNSNGQLGDGTTTDRLNPVDVAGLSSDVKSMALGQNFTCAVLPWGRLKCWGENTHGQLGDGSKIDSSLPVTAILPGVTVRQVAAGTGHTCVLTLAGSVLCWGDNTYGQLGDGSTTESTSPVVAIASGAVGIAPERLDQLRGDEQRRGQMLGAGRSWAVRAMGAAVPVITRLLRWMCR